MDRLVCGDVASARLRSRCARCSRRCRTGTRPPSSCRRRFSRSSTFRRSRQVRAVPDPSRGPVPFPHHLGGSQGRRRPGQRVGRRRDRDPSPPHARRPLQEARSSRGRRGAALRGFPQGGDQAADHRRRRADLDREPDPAHARDEPDGHPGPLAYHHPAVRASADPHLRGRARRTRRRRGDPARAVARGPDLLCPQSGARHRARRRRAAHARPRCPDRRCPRPDGRRDPRAGRARLLGRGLRRAGLHDDHRVGHRHALGQHPRRGPGRPPRFSASCTSCAAGSGVAGRRAYAYLLFPPDRVLSEQAYERLRTIGEHTELGSGFKIAMRDLEIRGAGTCSAGTNRAISRRSATTCTSGSWPKPSRS